MKAASIDDIKKQLKELPPKKLLELTLRLARFKKENKELLTYLLFEAGNASGYLESLQLEIDELFTEIDESRTYLAKKQLRKILRLINRQLKYIGSKTAAVELLLHFCTRVAEHKLTLYPKLASLFTLQLNKVQKLLPLVEEDLQYDYEQKLMSLKASQDTTVVKKKRWL